VTGGYNPDRSPERRNARPFVNLRARPQAEPEAQEPRAEPQEQEPKQP
jgi:hypothetical protein